MNAPTVTAPAALVEDGRAQYAAHVEAARAAERAGDWARAIGEYEFGLAVLSHGGTAGDAAEIFRWIGHAWRHLGEVELATEAYETSLEIADRSGLNGEVASALNALGIIEQFRGRFDAARNLYECARVLAMEAGETRLTALIAQNLGTLADIEGDTPGAIDAFAAALECFDELGDAVAAIGVLNNIGVAYTASSDWTQAERAYDEAFRLAELERNPELLGTVEINRALLFIRKGMVGAARECCDRAFELFSRNGSLLRLGETLKTYGVLFREMRLPGLADEHLTRAMEVATTSQHRLLEAEVCSEWAKLHLHEERNRQALLMLNRAQRLFDELHARRELHGLQRRLDGVEKTYLRVVKRWAESIEAADRYTAGHCQRVADYTCGIAETFDHYSPRDLVWIRMGALLHDVGKINVPQAVLNKPGKLDADEWELIRKHTTDGDAIVLELNFPWEISPMVRSHHERIDGRGYPDGLQGNDIPLTARMLCVADVFDALTSARSYRPALSADQALRLMEKDVGTAFDRDIFERFLSTRIWQHIQQPAALAS
jgi:putative nucleotidyltransferase with HDIG domain